MTVDEVVALFRRAAEAAEATLAVHDDMYKVAAAQQVFGRAAAEALNALKVIAFAKR